MSAVEQLSGVDRAWLLMERPTNPMMIIGLVILGGVLSRARLRALIAERFLTYQRFRCVPVADNVGVGASWIPSPGFDIDDHVLLAALPKSAGQHELEALAGELASTPLNRGRPLWTFHLVESFGSASAIIVRIHHCYADGIALVQVLLSLADAAPTAGIAHEPERYPGSADTISADLSPGFLPQVISRILREGSDLLGKGLHYALHPADTKTVVRDGIKLAVEVAGIALLSDDPLTSLKQPLSGFRRVAWTDPISLEEVSIIGHVLGCTVNDVLVSALAGALGRYLQSQGEKVTGVTIRAAVPVNMRAAGDPQPVLGNRFGLVFVDLPIGIRHPLERLYAVHAVMQKLKSSSQALAVLGLLSAIGNLPAAVEDPAIALFSAKASLVASNLPGPTTVLYFDGVPVSQLLFWVPQSGSIGTGVSMLAYCGRVQFGVIADRQVLPDPAKLVELIVTEFERLVYLILLGAGSMGD